jgi:hypothetical protein
MKHANTSREGTVYDECSQGRDPLAKTGNMVVTGSAVGGVLSIWMFIFIWGALPLVRPFLIGALALGGIFGFMLWFRRQ